MFTAVKSWWGRQFLSDPHVSHEPDWFRKGERSLAKRVLLMLLPFFGSFALVSHGAWFEVVSYALLLFGLYGLWRVVKAANVLALRHRWWLRAHSCPAGIPGGGTASELEDFDELAWLREHGYPIDEAGPGS